MAKFTLRELIIDINSKLDRKDFINPLNNQNQEQQTLYDSTELNSSKSLKRTRSSMIEPNNHRNESLKHDANSLSADKLNTSRSLARLNGDSITNSAFKGGKDGDHRANQE